MARIRTIKPEFWTSEQVMELSPLARLAFIGMWNFCDDGGNHPASAKTLKAEVFPADDISSDAVAALVNEAIAQGLLAEYQVNGKAYWHVTGWNHQKIDKPSKKYPQFPGETSATDIREIADSSGISRQEVGDESAPSSLHIDDSARSDTGSFREDSANVRRMFDEPSGTEGKGREGKGKEESQNTLVIADGADPSTSCPEPFKPEGKAHLPCPHEAIVAAYHELLPTCRRVAIWNPTRRGYLQARWREEVASEHWTEQSQGIEGFRDFFGYVAKSPFLTGRVAGANGKPPFVASLDWLLKPTNWANVLEGKYHRS